MQRMNVAIVNPVFVATFLGAPLLAGAAMPSAGRRAVVGDRRDRRSPWHRR